MINYIPIEIYASEYTDSIYRLVNIFQIPFSIVNEQFLEFITFINSNKDELTQDFVCKSIMKMIGEFLIYKEWGDVMDIKFAFDKQYIYLFLIDKPLKLNNNI